MGFLIKTIVLVVALAAVIPLVAGDSAVGELLSAAWADLAGFCSRQPDACADGAALARDAGAFIADTIADLGGAADPGTLTDADRTLAPARTAQPHDAFAGHGVRPSP